MLFALLIQVSTADLVHQLGDDNPGARDDAQAKLVEIGDAAASELKKTVDADDLELRARARLTLRRIERRAAGYLCFSRGDSFVFDESGDVFEEPYKLVRIGADGSDPIVLAERFDLEIGRSRDHTRVTFEGNDHVAWEIDASGTTRKPYSRNLSDAYASSPDGTKVACFIVPDYGCIRVIPGDGPSIRITNVGGGGERSAPVGGRVDSIVWNAEGTRIYYGLSTLGGIAVWSVDANAEDMRRIVQINEANSIRGLIGFVDSKRLLCSLPFDETRDHRSLKRLCILDVESGAVEPFAGLAGVGARMADISLDGRFVAFVVDGGVFVANSDGTYVEEVAVGATWNTPVAWIKPSSTQSRPPARPLP